MAAKSLGASKVAVTDGDEGVLRLAAANVQNNFPEAKARAGADGVLLVPYKFQLLAEGDTAGEEATKATASSVVGERWDVIVGSDLTYKRETWPTFVSSVKVRQAALRSGTG